MDTAAEEERHQDGAADVCLLLVPFLPKRRKPQQPTVIFGFRGAYPEACGWFQCCLYRSFSARREKTRWRLPECLGLIPLKPALIGVNRGRALAPVVVAPTRPHHP